MHLRVRDYRVYYEEQGSGPALILLHNATGSTRDWRKIAPLLAQQGLRVIAYDRGGFGRSDPWPQPHWSLDYLHHYRDELLAFMDALHLEQAALMGTSDGATIALLAAAASPHRIRSVVAESPHMWYEKRTLIPMFQQFETTIGQDPRFWKAMARAHGERAQEVVARWLNRWGDPAFMDWDEREALSHITCPVLVVHGRRDPFFPLAHSQTIAQALPRARLVVLEDIGHAPHLEADPHGYARLLMEFWDQDCRDQ